MGVDERNLQVMGVERFILKSSTNQVKLDFKISEEFAKYMALECESGRSKVQGVKAK